MSNVSDISQIEQNYIKSTKFNTSYIGKRNDILRLVPRGVKKVLDIGCSVGTLGIQIKQEIGAEIVGIELDHRMAEIAREHLDKVIIANVDEFDFDAIFQASYFDCVIFADILEHLNDPWSVLKNSTRIIMPSGVVIVSIPNIRHYTSILNLVLRGYWPYRKRGIHDKTHLRFFTLRNIYELFQSANLEIIRVRRNYRILEHPSHVNKLARFFAIPPFREFLAYQYLVVAKKTAKY